jgi:hypothetical protein
MTLLTVSELGDYVGRDLSSDDGAAMAVAMASETVKTLTEQDFGAVTAETVHLDGTGTDTLLLPQVPVTAAGTVVVNGGTLDNNEYTVSSDGRLVRIYHGTDGTASWSTWGRTRSASAYWPQGRGNVSVTYQHGYSGTVPDDVKMVALAIANRLVTQGGKIQEQIGQASARYAVSSTDLTVGERAILRKYKQAQ